MNNYFIIAIYIILIIFTDFTKLSVKVLELVTVEVTLAVTLAYDFLTTIISLISVIFDSNIFNFVSVLFIKVLILLLSIIVDDGNELFKLG